MKRTFTRIEPVWKINEDEVSRLEYGGCEVYRYWSRCPKWWKKPSSSCSLERTSDGWRELLEHFDTISEAKAVYPRAVVA